MRKLIIGETKSFNFVYVPARQQWLQWHLSSCSSPEQHRVASPWFLLIKKPSRSQYLFIWASRRFSNAAGSLGFLSWPLLPFPEGPAFSFRLTSPSSFLIRLLSAVLADRLVDTALALSTAIVSSVVAAVVVVALTVVPASLAIVPSSVVPTAVSGVIPIHLSAVVVVSIFCHL